MSAPGAVSVDRLERSVKDACELIDRLKIANEAMRSALKRISDRDPCPSKDPEICGYTSDPDGCIGCYARRVLRDVQGVLA